MKNKPFEVLIDIDGPTSKMFYMTGFAFECHFGFVACWSTTGIHDLLEMHNCSVLGRLLITNYCDCFWSVLRLRCNYQNSLWTGSTFCL